MEHEKHEHGECEEKHPAHDPAAPKPLKPPPPEVEGDGDNDDLTPPARPPEGPPQ